MNICHSMLIRPRCSNVKQADCKSFECAKKWITFHLMSLCERRRSGKFTKILECIFIALQHDQTNRRVAFSFHQLDFIATGNHFAYSFSSRLFSVTINNIEAQRERVSSHWWFPLFGILAQFRGFHWRAQFLSR